MLPLPSSRPASLPRRTAVGGMVAAAAVAVTGCTPRGIDRRRRPRPSPSATPDEDPDVSLAASVLREEQRVLDVVLRTVAQHPGLAAALAGARTAHEAHVDLLTDAVPHEDRPRSASPPADPSDPSETSSDGPTAATPSASVVAVPRRRRAALLALATEEDRLSLLDRRSAFAAESGAFARVLGSMAAAASQQAATLTAAAQVRR